MDKQRLLKGISVVLVCIVLGFIISVQLKSVRISSLGTSTSARNEELQKLLGAEREKTTSLQDQINQMQATIDNYRTSIEQTGSAYAGLKSDLASAENLAGLTEVCGNGIIVTLEDAKMPEGANAAESILHDADVRSVVNELLAAGAEGVSINDERVISTTAIRCVGPVIMVNNSRSSTPISIKAIGDSTSLENALNMNGGILSELRAWNFGVSIQKMEEIVLPAYSGTVSFKYLKPVKTSED